MYEMTSQVQTCEKERKGYILSLYWHMEDIFLDVRCFGWGFLLHAASPILPDGISGTGFFLCGLSENTLPMHFFSDWS